MRIHSSRQAPSCHSTTCHVLSNLLSHKRRQLRIKLRRRPVEVASSVTGASWHMRSGATDQDAVSDRTALTLAAITLMWWFAIAFVRRLGVGRERRTSINLSQLRLGRWAMTAPATIEQLHENLHALKTPAISLEQLEHCRTVGDACHRGHRLFNQYVRLDSRAK